ncbi:MAG: hypothetical protein ABSD59_10780 [Terracidiphilus sp.]
MAPTGSKAENVYGAKDCAEAAIPDKRKIVVGINHRMIAPHELTRPGLLPTLAISSAPITAKQPEELGSLLLSQKSIKGEFEIRKNMRGIGTSWNFNHAPTGVLSTPLCIGETKGKQSDADSNWLIQLLSFTGRRYKSILEVTVTARCII